MKNYKYSICMINLNMEAYIESSVISILNQIDDDYELLIVDGGSSDSSIQKLKKIQGFYKNIRIIELERDARRKIGKDRNISIECACGEYVLLHLDCDDIYMGKIKEWVETFHIIEKIVKKDMLVVGKHINMAKRDFLLNYGPYKNIHFEDRELWNRLVKIGQYIGINHKDFVIRMNLGYARKITKTINRTFHEMLENMVYGGYSVGNYIAQEIKGFKRRKLRHIFLRIIIFPLSLCAALGEKKYKYNPEVLDYKTSNYESIFDLIEKFNASLSKEELKFLEGSIFNV
jgi:glycosyltransferase involved in cell wall biosynthesis